MIKPQKTRVEHVDELAEIINSAYSKASTIYPCKSGVVMVVGVMLVLDSLQSDANDERYENLMTSMKALLQILVNDVLEAKINNE